MVTQFVEKFIRNSKEWKEAEQAARDELQGRREQLISEIKAIRENAGEIAPANTERLEKAGEAVKDAIVALKAAQLEHAGVSREIRGATLMAQSQIASKEQELRDNCPVAVGNFIAEVGAQQDSFRSSSSNWPYTEIQYWSNNQLRPASVPDKDRMDLIHQAYRDARIEAEALFLSDSPDIEGDVAVCAGAYRPSWLRSVGKA